MKENDALFQASSAPRALLVLAFGVVTKEDCNILLWVPLIDVIWPKPHNLYSGIYKQNWQWIEDTPQAIPDTNCMTDN